RLMLRLAAVIFFLIVAGFIWANGPKPSDSPKDNLPPTLSLKTIPLGLDANRAVPKDNLLTEAKVRLGRQLFFDPILSADGTVSCASCHDPGHGLASRERLGRGFRGQETHRNPPSLWNRAYGTSFFWDGRESTLEAQALRPIESATEMGGTIDRALE